MCFAGGAYGRHAEANRIGPKLLLEMARICREVCGEWADVLPLVTDAAYAQLCEKLSLAEQV